MKFETHIETGQFWMKKDNKYYVYEIDRIIASNGGYVSAECHVWYKAAAQRFTRLSKETAVLTVRAVDMDKWRILDITDLTF